MNLFTRLKQRMMAGRERHEQTLSLLAARCADVSPHAGTPPREPAGVADCDSLASACFSAMHPIVSPQQPTSRHNAHRQMQNRTFCDDYERPLHRSQLRSV